MQVIVPLQWHCRKGYTKEPMKGLRMRLIGFSGSVNSGGNCCYLNKKVTPGSRPIHSFLHEATGQSPARHPAQPRVEHCRDRDGENHSCL